MLDGKYQSLRQMESDLVLMTDNAKRYNEPKSVIYKDACKLRREARAACKELEALLAQGKTPQSNKTREKKLKLLQEVAQEGEDDDGQQVSADQDQEQENEAGDNEEEEEDEEEDSEEEEMPSKKAKSSEMEVEEGDEECVVVGKARKKQAPGQMITSMWSLFDFIKDFKNGNQNLIEPFLKLPSKRSYPDYYEEIKQPIAMNGNNVTAKLTLKN